MSIQYRRGAAAGRRESLGNRDTLADGVIRAGTEGGHAFGDGSEHGTQPYDGPRIRDGVVFDVVDNGPWSLGKFLEMRTSVRAGAGGKHALLL